MGDVLHEGEHLEIDRPTAAGLHLRRGCEVTLTHSGVLPEWAERTREGWGLVNLGPAI